MFHPSALRIFVATLSVCCGVCSRSQTSIVNWGGNYVSANTDLARTGTPTSNFGNIGGTATNDSRRLTTFDISTSMNPSLSYSGTSSTFYGGWQAIRYDSSSSPATGFQRVTNNSTTDAITFRADLSSGTGTGEAQGLVLWKKSDFLNLSSNTVTFGSSSSFAITLGSNTANLTEARWVVKDGSNYYISQTSFTGTTTTNNLSSLLWASYDPTTAIKSSASSFSSITLTDVQAVGVYFAGNSLTWTSATVGGLRVDIEAFSATATAVPESSTYAAIAGVFALSGVAWHRRKSRHAVAKP